MDRTRRFEAYMLKLMTRLVVINLLLIFMVVGIVGCSHFLLKREMKMIQQSEGMVCVKEEVMCPEFVNWLPEIHVPEDVK